MRTVQICARCTRTFIAVAVLAGISGIANAAQVTFTVPIELRDIDVRYPFVEVGCFLRSAQNQQLGYNSVRIDIRPNARPYVADVVVPVDPSPGMNALDVKRYSCLVAFCTSANDTNCLRSGLPGSPGLQVQPGVPHTSQVDGAIN